MEKKIESSGHVVYFESGLKPLEVILNSNKYKQIFLLTDIHTTEHCLPVFTRMLNGFSEFDLIEMDPGEESKNIDYCIGIWQTLLDFGAERKSLLINLGGGVVSDMGGFVASTYKRGVDFINVPTTLLAQVDASLGGKTGIDVNNVKNMVGTFSLPQAVFIEHSFLKTLSKREMRSGFAEMIKHGLIADINYFDTLSATPFDQVNSDLVYRSVEIKNSVVTEDPLEQGLRKILNFGHTIGHAVESYSLSHDENPLTHGEAIAVGMICEAWLSLNQSDMSIDDVEKISVYIRSVYPCKQIPENAYDELMEHMQKDKKNEGGKIMFSTLKGPGVCLYNQSFEVQQIADALNYYNRKY